MKRYYRSKWDYYVQIKMDQLKMTTRNIEYQIFEAGIKDERAKIRADYMYNYMDYNNDRARVRDRFMKEMNKKTTLEDIGRELDKMLIDEKAESIQFYDPSKEDDIKFARKDHKVQDLTWSGRIFKNMDPL